MKTIIAIGGTGQLVLHYYLLQYFAGIIDSSIRAIVLDTDKLLESLKKMKEFFEYLQYGQEAYQALGTSIPVIDYYHLEIPKAGDNLFELVTDQSLSSRRQDQFYAVQAFYTTESLAQPIAEGIYARPAIASLIQHMILEKLTELNLHHDERIVVVGSVLGGTGGGFIGPVIDKVNDILQKHTGKGRQIRAVLFGQYFHPEEGSNITSERLQSNEILTLYTFKEFNLPLHSYILIRALGDDRISRNSLAEKEARNLPLPDRHNHPIWRGVLALHYLLEERQEATKEDFLDRDRSNINFNFPELSLPKIRDKLSRGIQAVEKLIKYKLLECIADEPVPRSHWGDRLTMFLSHFWKIALQENEIEAHSFINRVQQQLSQWWNKRRDDYSLYHVLPDVPTTKIKPYHLIQADWPLPEENKLNRRLFKSFDEIVKRTAVNILFWTLKLNTL